VSTVDSVPADCFTFMGVSLSKLCAGTPDPLKHSQK
jgi:hypothetical protein